MLNVQNLYDPRHIDILHHVNQALRAHTNYKRDVHYIVKDGQVIIVDEFTGRLMPGRRWSDGLHQAVEAKEGVRIERENQTLATITIQNYFRMYRKLAGMTGTADTEAAEFEKTYKLTVVVIPPNKGQARKDHPDVVYKSEREKFDAVVEQIAECYERRQPVLVGTISVEKSEHLSRLLKRRNVKHNVLNAVNHEAEANIIAQAGRSGTVTIATNMAGRGTDILLGGNPEFLARAEMENEWMRRTSNLPEGGLRYEDVLAGLRERFDQAVESARAAHEPKWAPLAEGQSKALEDLTAAHRAYLDADFWESRGAYEAAASDAGSSGGEAYVACATAAERYGEALQEVDRVTGPHFGEEGVNRFQHALGNGVAPCANRRAMALPRRSRRPGWPSTALARSTSAPCSGSSGHRPRWRLPRPRRPTTRRSRRMRRRRRRTLPRAPPSRRRSRRRARTTSRSGRSTPRSSTTSASRWTRLRTSCAASTAMCCRSTASCARSSGRRSLTPVVSSSSARSGTRAGASTTSCAVAPAARAIPARRGSSSHSRTTCCASSAPSASRG
jgi:hypothetical protein